MTMGNDEVMEAYGMSEQIPSALRVAISRDLRPVKPLPRPVWRALPLLPVAVLLLTSAVFIFGLRRDSPQLGWTLTWIASTLQMMFGLVLAVLALREAVPGTTLSQRTVRVAFAIAGFGVALVTWLTWLASSTFSITPGYGAWVWRVCVAGTVVGALPALAVSGWLVARAFPLRPRLAGALYGVGAGLMSDAGWRLFCHFSSPGHVFGAHVLGIGICAGLGILTALALGTRR
jgi:hypothetical protein